MRRFRVMHRRTHEVDVVTALNNKEACQRLGWRLDECWIVELTPVTIPSYTGRYVNSPKKCPTRKIDT